MKIVQLLTAHSQPCAVWDATAREKEFSDIWAIQIIPKNPGSTTPYYN